MLKNLNNKGNTLGIVLVGICILSILGTLILGVTSTNYYMKLNDKKTEMVFYHTEKAVDELYTIIGNDVMKSAKEAYATVLAKAVKSETIGGVIEYKERENLSELFYTEYTDSIKNKYKVDITGSANLQSIIASWQSAITPVTGYSINVKRITTGANKTEVVHIVDSSTSKLKQIDIKNVCVECISDTTKNSVNIVTDFTIKVPEVVLNFDDSLTAGTASLDDFCTYALIAQGDGATNASTVSPTFSINGSGNKATIKGNIYLGGNDYVVNSLFVGNKAELTCLSQVIYCEKNTVLQDGIAELRSIVQTSSIDTDVQYNTKDTLQFFTNNISTEDGGITENGYPSLSISGNCIVADDLEINDVGTQMKLSGNYFGYGYRKKTFDWTEADSTAFDITSIVSPGYSSVEHKQSSAIIINEKDAELDFTGLKKLVLAGRAYIDLDEEGGINTSYMTGESLSYKGNQVIYQADDSYLAAKGLSNGMEVGELEAKCSGEVTYEGLGLQSVIAKKVAEKVYFYNEQNNPVAQSKYFKDAMENADGSYTGKVNELKDKIKQLNSTVKFSNDLDKYTVGAVVETNSGNITSTTYDCGSDGITSADSKATGNLGFRNILQDISTRKGHMIPSLHNIDASDLNSYLGHNYCNEPSPGISGTPLQYYLKDEFINGSDKNIRTEVTDTDKRNQISAILGGADLTATKIGYAIINDSSVSQVILDSANVGFDIGIIVTTKPVVVKKDFVGMIITKDSISVQGDVSIAANKDIAELMFEIEELRNLINDGFGGGITIEEDVDVVKLDNSLSYENLVEKSNWRKNIN